MCRNEPIETTERDNKNVIEFHERVPQMIRILRDIADERYDRLEELTESSRIILERLGL